MIGTFEMPRNRRGPFFSSAIAKHVSLGILKKPMAGAKPPVGGRGSLAYLPPAHLRTDLIGAF